MASASNSIASLRIVIYEDCMQLVRTTLQAEESVFISRTCRYRSIILEYLCVLGLISKPAPTATTESQPSSDRDPCTAIIESTRTAPSRLTTLPLGKLVSTPLGGSTSKQARTMAVITALTARRARLARFCMDTVSSPAPPSW